MEKINIKTSKNTEINTENNRLEQKVNTFTLYLGLHIKESQEKIHELITKGLIGIIELYPNIEDAQLLIKLIENNIFTNEECYNKPWRYPKEKKIWHVTTLFKRGKQFTKSHPAFMTFEKGKLINIEIRGIVYIPERIITSLVFTETPVENEFPHMTTLLGTYSAKNSNDVCKELFSKDKPMEKEYKKMLKNELNDDSFVQKLEITLLGKKEIAYVYKFAAPIIFETEMEAFQK